MEETNQKRLPRRVRAAIKELIDTHVAETKQHSDELQEACMRAFEETGFHIYDDEGMEESAWEILPHRTVMTKLYVLWELEGVLDWQVRHGSLDEISAALEEFDRVAAVAFAEVQEFLNGQLVKMTRDEWFKHPLYKQLLQTREARWIAGSIPATTIGDIWSPETQEREDALRN